MSITINKIVAVSGPVLIGLSDGVDGLRLLNLGPAHAYVRPMHVLAAHKSSNLDAQGQQAGPASLPLRPELLEPAQERVLFGYDHISQFKHQGAQGSAYLTLDAMLHGIEFTYSCEVIVPGHREVVKTPALQFKQTRKDDIYLDLV